MNARVIWRGILALLLLLVVVPPASAQDATPDPVLEMMEQMSPEMKVGQLVLVSFPGTKVANSEIAALIRDYGVGGVLLQPRNGNFGTRPLTQTQLISMTNALHTFSWEASQGLSSATDDTALPSTSPYVPLLVAVPSEFNGIPITSFISGTSALPTPLALGATWNPELAEATGEVVGRELTAMGINTFLGPGLDINTNPRPGDPADLGTRTFGSSPFWVGEMGKEYVSGLHKGGEGRLLVVPRHLPGMGSVDRLLEEEVPTVQKSLEDLKKVELAPFFEVASGDLGKDAGVADAFLVTHVRYRGFQGTARPISLDAQALQLVMGLEDLKTWREQGGVLVSDNLGLRSVHLAYTPSEFSFNARRVAEHALNAGNDLLMLDRFAADDSWDTHFTNVRDTLKYLASRYRNEPTFRVIVDNAVYRILSMKMRLYPRFALSQVQVDPEGGVDEVTQNVTVQVASDSMTLLFPLAEDLLPTPPQVGDRIVVFSQELYAQPFENGELFPMLSRDAFVRSLLRFYGPEGTGVVGLNQVEWFTFEQLRLALDAPDDAVESGFASRLILDAVRQARWIVFVSAGLVPNDPDAYALKSFLAQKADGIDGRIVVLAFGPPYELDSTEIGKLDLYYALYSVEEAFVEAGVRALFRDLLAPGDSPVNIPALNYNLAMQTTPDPGQVIPLYLVNTDGEPLTEEDKLTKGDVINIQTGLIIDQNGHPVPDGTPVQFILSYPQESVEQNVVAESVAGVGETSVTLDRVGQLNITVQAEPAVSSVRLQLTVREDETVDITTSTPTPEPTPVPVTPTPEVESPVKLYLPERLRLPAPRRWQLLTWGVGGTLLVLVVGFSWARDREASAVYAVRLGLWGALSSLVTYVVLIAAGRWWFPAWRYGLVHREFLVGLATAGMGGLVVLAIILIRRFTVHRAQSISSTT